MDAHTCNSCIARFDKKYICSEAFRQELSIDLERRLWRDRLRLCVLNQDISILHTILYDYSNFRQITSFLTCKICSDLLVWKLKEESEDESNEIEFVCSSCQHPKAMLQCNLTTACSVLMYLMDKVNPQLVASAFYLTFIGGKLLNGLSAPLIPDNPIDILFQLYEQSSNTFKFGGCGGIEYCSLCRETSSCPSNNTRSKSLNRNRNRYINKNKNKNQNNKKYNKNNSDNGNAPQYMNGAAVIADIVYDTNYSEFPILYVVDTISAPTRYYLHALKFMNVNNNNLDNEFNPDRIHKTEIDLNDESEVDEYIIDTTLPLQLTYEQNIELINELMSVANNVIKSHSYLVLGPKLQTLISSDSYTNSSVHNLSYIITIDALRALHNTGVIDNKCFPIKNFEQIVTPAIDSCKIALVTAFQEKNISSMKTYNDLYENLQLYLTTIVWLGKFGLTPFESLITYFTMNGWFKN